MQKNIILTSPGGQVLTRVDWQRAARLLVTTIPSGGYAAYNFEGSPLIRMVHTPNTKVAVHRVVFQTENAYRPWHGRTMDSHASREAILARDRHRCAYCGGYGDEAEHIFPESRGGRHTFGNLVTACGPCNRLKADRTPEEAGMPLLYLPFVNDPWAADQEEVHRLFELE